MMSEDGQRAPIDIAAADYLLSTTRAVRRRLDLTRPVQPTIIERCIEIATQAPSGGNEQGWHFIVITNRIKLAILGEIYRRAFFDLSYMRRRAPSWNDAEELQAAQTRRVMESAGYLAENMASVPAMIIPCIDGRAEHAGVLAQAGLYGSILPAVWSLMLALRARGVGSAWTTVHLLYEKEVARLLGIPDHVTQAALVPLAYFTGTGFKPAKRLPARERTYWDSWGKRR